MLSCNDLKLYKIDKTSRELMFKYLLKYNHVQYVQYLDGERFRQSSPQFK